MTLVTGKIFQINDLTKRLWDRFAGATAFEFFDNAVGKNAVVLNVDYLFGKVEFVST